VTFGEIMLRLAAPVGTRLVGAHSFDPTFGAGRLGIYFLELGASQRASRVIYDRSDSCVATATAVSASCLKHSIRVAT
jgi:hypothetical protein